MSKPTTGPWEVWEGHLDIYAGPSSCNDEFGIVGYRHEIARCDEAYDNGDIELDEAEANARLIAAAPDLLSLCEELSYFRGQLPEALVSKLMAVIKKAKGRE